jgi:hypothetical protein
MDNQKILERILKDIKSGDLEKYRNEVKAAKKAAASFSFASEQQYTDLLNKAKLLYSIVSINTYKSILNNDAVTADVKEHIKQEENREFKRIYESAENNNIQLLKHLF